MYIFRLWTFRFISFVYGCVFLYDHYLCLCVPSRSLPVFMYLQVHYLCLCYAIYIYVYVRKNWQVHLNDRPCYDIECRSHQLNDLQYMWLHSLSLIVSSLTKYFYTHHFLLTCFQVKARTHWQMTKRIHDSAMWRDRRFCLVFHVLLRVFWCLSL